jgi:hypothetical protein
MNVYPTRQPKVSHVLKYQQRRIQGRKDHLKLSMVELDQVQDGTMESCPF